jgi:hypothetical protein
MAMALLVSQLRGEIDDLARPLLASIEDCEVTVQDDPEAPEGDDDRKVQIAVSAQIEIGSSDGEDDLTSSRSMYQVTPPISPANASLVCTISELLEAVSPAADGGTATNVKLQQVDSAEGEVGHSDRDTTVGGGESQA